MNNYYLTLDVLKLKSVKLIVMWEDQSERIEELIFLLKEKKSVLMAGAGSSQCAGYPSWKGLIKNLRNEFHEDLDINFDEDELDIVADEIKNHAESEGRLKEYYNYIEDTFQPSETHCEIHENLLQLDFCAVVTTNYDEVLEHAIGGMLSQEYGYTPCRPKDLCSDRYYPIIKYLRSISPLKKPNSVLHLHGHYLNPDKIILTHDDYVSRYGKVIKESIESAEGEERLAVKVPLGEIHTKVIWSLLTSYNFVFVGFSMADPFFLKILEIANFDFDYPTSMHHAIMPFSTDEDKERASILLEPRGVKPIFYYVPENSSDHSLLENLIHELVSKLEETGESEEGTVIEEETGEDPSLDSVSNNLLEY